MSLIAELKRRNVFKVGAAYLALAWLVLQLTSIVVPAFELPAGTTKLVIWLGVIGFPCVLIFAWVYELTPEGLKRESEIDRSHSITHVTGKRLDYIIIALLIVAIGLFLLQYLRPSAPEAPATAEAVTPATSPAVQAESPASPQPALAIAPDDKSIAVLPFVNMSSDKEQEYFSDGMSEELLNLLAKVPELKVIARTSSFAFKGKDVPIAEIAKQLGVAHILEGSVRKAGNTVRITAQLIRTADSTHLWSETYDRPLDDIFKVQDEIAGAIVQALQIRMAGGTLNRREGGTQNLKAYELYLRGWAHFNEYTAASLEDARKLFEEAVTIDPDFGLAWSSLADVAISRAMMSAIPTQTGFQAARELVDRSIELSPNNVYAYGLDSELRRRSDWDWVAAQSAVSRALAIDSTSPDALDYAGRVARTLGRWDESERVLRIALVRDPLNVWVMFSLGMTHYGAGRFVDAETAFRGVLEITPNFSFARNHLAKTLVAQGKSEDALVIVNQQSDAGDKIVLLPVVLHAAGKTAEARQAQRELEARWADECA